MQLYLIQIPLFHGRIIKMLRLLSFLCVSIFICTPELRADHDYNDLYLLPRLGSLVINSSNIENIQIVGVVAGLRVDNALYIETELNTYVSGGEYFSGSEKGRLRVSNLSLYGVYRYVFNKRYYGKLKTGIAYNSVKYEISNRTDVNNNSDDFNGAIGLGFGIVFSVFTNPHMVELEYARTAKNTEMFTIGTTIPF